MTRKTLRLVIFSAASPLHLGSLASVMCAILYFPFSSSIITQADAPFSFFISFPCFWHTAFSPIELRAKVSWCPLWLSFMASRQAPADPGYLFHTMDSNNGYDPTLSENNQFAVISSRETSNADPTCMDLHELETLLCISARSCDLMSKWLGILAKAHLNDIATQELGFFDDYMAVSQSSRDCQSYSVERVVFKPFYWSGMRALTIHFAQPSMVGRHLGAFNFTHWRRAACVRRCLIGILQLGRRVRNWSE